MFRDRTNLYLSYRRTYPHHSGASRFDAVAEEEGLIGTKSIELVPLPPSFLDIGEEIDELVDDITKQTDKLNGLYKRNLLPGFNDRSTDEEEIQKLNYAITSKFLKCQNSVKKFGALKEDLRLKADDLNMIDNMQKNYALKVQQLSSNFRKLQNNYIKFLKKDEFEQTPKLSLTEATYNPAIVDDTEEMESYSREAIKESSTILQQSSNINDSMIRQREQEITKLAQGVLEVSSIFKEMQNMVIEQGTVLDRIDYNIENTKVDLKQANQELNRATHYQKRTQKCKIILLLSLVVLLLFVIVVTKPYRHVGGSSERVSSPSTGDETDVPDKDRSAIQADVVDDNGTLDNIDGILDMLL
jgi:syntaxin 16